MSEVAPADAAQEAAALHAKLSAAGALPFFEKCLTNSDAAGNGRVVLPKAVAELQFKDFLETPGAAVPVLDLDGKACELRFRSWSNNHSRMYLLENCNGILERYSLGFGDVIVLAKRTDGVFVDDVVKRLQARKNRAPVERTARAANVRRKVGVPLTDGIFRSKPDVDASRKVFAEGSTWVCALDIEGETFQALFDLEADAWETYHAVAPA